MPDQSANARESERRKMATIEAASWLEANRGYTREETNEAGGLAVKKKGTLSDYIVIIAIQGAKDGYYKRFLFTVHMRNTPMGKNIVEFRSEAKLGEE